MDEGAARLRSLSTDHQTYPIFRYSSHSARTQPASDSLYYDSLAPSLLRTFPRLLRPRVIVDVLDDGMHPLDDIEVAVDGRLLVDGMHAAAGAALGGHEALRQREGRQRSAVRHRQLPGDARRCYETGSSIPRPAPLNISLEPGTTARPVSPPWYPCCRLTSTGRRYVRCRPVRGWRTCTIANASGDQSR